MFGFGLTLEGFGVVCLSGVGIWGCKGVVKELQAGRIVGIEIRDIKIQNRFEFSFYMFLVEK